MALRLLWLAAAQQGYFATENKQQFLFCSTSACVLKSTPTQEFKKHAGKNGESEFRIIVDGKDTGQCLDRVNCHHNHSPLRMGSCGHCGAVHWQFHGSSTKPGMLAEDHSKNCVQDSGSLEHCSQAHVPLLWPVDPASGCKKTVTLKNLQCAQKGTGGECLAGWTQGSVNGAHAQAECNACDAPTGSELSCDFKMSVETTKDVTTTFESATGMEVGASFKFGMNFIVEGEATLSYSLDETLTYGHSKSVSDTQSIASGCSEKILAGTAAAAAADFLTGTLKADFTAEVHTDWSCPHGSKKSGMKSTTGSLHVTNVPTQSLDGSCTLKQEACPKVAALMV